MIVNTNLTIWDLLQAIIPVANRQSLDMARRCKELCNIHQIKSTIHCLGINLTNIQVLWDHIWLNWYRFPTSVVREMWSDRGDSVFYSLIGRSILMNWAFAQQLGVLIPQRVCHTIPLKTLRSFQCARISKQTSCTRIQDTRHPTLCIGFFFNGVVKLH